MEIVSAKNEAVLFLTMKSAIMYEIKNLGGFNG